MNKKKAIAVVGAGLLAAVGAGAVLLSRTAAPRSEALPADSRAAATRAEQPPLPSSPTGAACGFSPGWAATYDYHSETMGVIRMGTLGASQTVQSNSRFAGKLSFEALSHSGTERVLLGQFQGLNAEATQAIGKGVDAAFLLKVSEKCEVQGFARLKTVDRTVAQSQQVAIHNFWFSAPAEGAPIALSFENGVGVAAATFQRVDQKVTRQVGSYQTVWAPTGGLAVASSTLEVTLDGQWFERLRSVEKLSGGKLESSELVLTIARAATAVPVSVASSRNPADYVWDNLLSEQFVAERTDLAASPSEARYVERMKNQTLPVAFEQLMVKVQSRQNIEDQWHEMAGFLTGHPEQLATFGKGLHEADFPESVKGVSYLVLSKVPQSEARDQLLALHADHTLSSRDRLRASLALATRKDVGVDFARVLREESGSGGFDARTSMLHLGILANTHANDPAVVAEARGAVSQGLEQAGTDPSQLSPVLGAIGNMADAERLPQLVELTRVPNVEVRSLVPSGLRGYPYAQTEALIVEWMARETSPEVKEEVFDVVVHQLADAQRSAGPGMVHEALRHLKLQPRVMARQPIIHILGGVVKESDEAREALINQYAVEFRNQSGLQGQVGRYLGSEQTMVALSRMPEFAHQFNGGGK